jgi:integrase
MHTTPLLHYAPIAAIPALLTTPSTVSQADQQKWTTVAHKLAMGKCNEQTLASYAERLIAAARFNPRLLLPIPARQAWDLAAPYFASLSGQSWGSILGIRTALAKATVSAGLSHPFDVSQNRDVDARWQGFFQALKQAAPHKNCAKDPLSVHTVQQIVQYWQQQGTLHTQRLAAQLTLTYVARARYSEAARATTAQFKDRGDGAGIDWTLPRKQQKHGSQDYVIPLPEKTYAGLKPASIMRALRASVPNDGALQFRRTQASKRGHPHDRWATGPEAWRHFSSNSFLKELRAALRVVHPTWTSDQLESIGTHSMRRGCVTQMYRAGSTYLHGKGWLRHKASNAALRYITTNLEEQRAQLALLGYEAA